MSHLQEQRFNIVNTASLKCLLEYKPSVQGVTATLMRCRSGKCTKQLDVVNYCRIPRKKPGAMRWLQMLLAGSGHVADNRMFRMCWLKHFQCSTRRCTSEQVAGAQIFATCFTTLLFLSSSKRALIPTRDGVPALGSHHQGSAPANLQLNLRFLSSAGST